LKREGPGVTAWSFGGTETDSTLKEEKECSLSVSKVPRLCPLVLLIGIHVRG
jgi:hypothetical protein